ncbi:MAG: prepilin peptidase, partial [Nitrospirae bacterium]|nr:prepilin peptidase [Nitrospirota bacterium]
MNGAYPVKQRPGWFMTLLTYLFIYILGAVIGSFLNVCIYRIPKQESIAAPASHCPQCNAPIRFYDNIPILSFLILRGRCRTCGTPISVQYVIVEILNGAGYMLLIGRFGLSTESILYAILFSALLVASVIDLHHRIIPDVITIPGTIAGLLAGAFILPGGIEGSVIGTLLGSG